MYTIAMFHSEGTENRAIIFFQVCLPFDETIKRYQDWDFGIRAAKQFALCYLPEALVESKVGEDSISARVTSYPPSAKAVR